MSDEIKNVIDDENDDDMLEEDNIIELEDEDGNVKPYVLVASVEYKEKEYVMLQPNFETDDPSIVYVYKIEYDKDGNVDLYELESDEEEKAVFEEFKLILGEDFDFADED